MEWSDERKSQFAVDWLWQHRYSDDALHEVRSVPYGTPAVVNAATDGLLQDREQRKVTPWPHTSRLPEVQFDAGGWRAAAAAAAAAVPPKCVTLCCRRAPVMESDRGLFEWLTNLVQHGVCMVKVRRR
ncbi:MAG: hypothetical protein ACK4ZJ_18660 [Allorhizobium sp.]